MVYEVSHLWFKIVCFFAGHEHGKVSRKVLAILDGTDSFRVRNASNLRSPAIRRKK
jgi:hypothetical protein